MTGITLVSPTCEEIVATLERWPLVRRRSKYIDISIGKVLWRYLIGWAVLGVATKRAICYKGLVHIPL